MVDNIVKQENVMVFLVKFALLVILKEKNQLKQKNLNMKVLGIGNAIVDVICKVEENFIKEKNLTKGTMKLFFDEIEFKSLLGSLKIEKTISGGSVANSIVGLSQLKNDVGFIGKYLMMFLGLNMRKDLKRKMLNIFIQKIKKVFQQALV